MNAAGRLAAYAGALVVVFGGAFAVAAAVVPASAVRAWQERAEGTHEVSGSDPRGHDSGAGGNSADSDSHPVADAVRGLSLAQDGYLLSPISAPSAVGRPGQLSFRVLDIRDQPVTDFAVSHEKEMHLITVRADGTRFRHVHPTLDQATGTWSVPWTWPAAGSYRVFADFVPAAEGAPNITLTRTVDVSGTLTPRPATEVRRTDRVDDFDLRLSGDLRAGQTSELSVEIARGGRPVTNLQPYLGAFGHLVALRDGDLAFLHVHPEGEEPTTDATAGPTIAFGTEAPTPGRYLLYLDFQVDGQVRTAQFVLEAAA